MECSAGSFAVTKDKHKNDKRSKHLVTHKCGHSQNFTVFEADKEVWLSDLAESDCSSCWLKKQPPSFSLRTSATLGPAIDVMMGYPIREELKARGYRFQRPRWMKWFHTEAEREEELLWARERGFEVQGG